MNQLATNEHVDDLRAGLTRCRLFNGLSNEQLDAVARHGDFILYQQREVIARQGEQADGFFIMIEGETVVEIEARRSESSFQLTTLAAGDFFGEMATLLGSERNAHVITSTPECKVLRFSGEQFKNMLRNLPFFAASLAHSLAYRLQRTSVQKSGVKAVDVDELPAEVLRLIPEAFCIRYRVLPIQLSDETLDVGFVDDPTPEVLDRIQAFAPSLRPNVKRISQHEFNGLLRQSVWPSADRGAETSHHHFDLKQLLARCISEGASDLHLSTDRVPRWRIDGELLPIHGYPAITSTQLVTSVQTITPTILQGNTAGRDLDFAYEIAGGERFRVNIYQDMNGTAVALRHIPSRVLTLTQLGAPSILKAVCDRPKGLFLVTGPTGSGKSTTLAAMIDLINQNHARHIITLEDPIEYRHESQRALVNQREIGVHTGSFAEALRSALREDPDVVLVGEMRDLETIALALEVAQTGHLVFATLHTTSAVGTIERIVGMFDSEKQAQIRDTLADVLVGVVSQTLLKRLGGGRTAAYEIMMNSPAIANLIREMKTVQIASYLSTGRSTGNQSLEDDLNRLISEGKTTLEEARKKSSKPEKLRG